MENQIKAISHHHHYSISMSGDVRNSSGKILKPRLRKKTGYYAVILYKPQRTYQVHRLVAEAFIPNPENKPEINHCNGDKAHNFYSNLEWATHSENEKHSYRVLGKVPSYGKSSLCLKIKVIKGNLSQEFESINEAIRNTGYSRLLIKRFINQSRVDPDGFSWYNT